MLISILVGSCVSSSMVQIQSHNSLDEYLYQSLVLESKQRETG